MKPERHLRDCGPSCDWCAVTPLFTHGPAWIVTRDRRLGERGGNRASRLHILRDVVKDSDRASRKRLGQQSVKLSD